MVIAWVGLASVGIFMARYMKVAFGDKELLGTKMWFTVRTAPSCHEYQDRKWPDIILHLI